MSKDTIELNEICSDMDLEQSQLKLRLQNTPLLDGISVNETQDEVVILLATIGSLHRLRFPHPRRLPQPGSRSIFSSSGKRVGLSIFHNFSIDSLRDPRNFHVLSNVYPVYASGPQSGPLLCHSWLQNGNEAVFILSNNSASLVAVHMGAERVQSFEFRGNNLMDKLKGLVPSLIRSSQDSEEAPLCLTSHRFPEDRIVIGLCRDLRIRFWSFSRQKCLHVMSLQGAGCNSNLNNSLDASSLTIRRPAIRKVDAGEAVLIVLYINVNELRQFIAYKVHQTASGGLEVLHIASLNTAAGEDPVDFQLHGNDLMYLTCDNRMQSKVRRTCVKE